jgi:hypothetical protein
MISKLAAGRFTLSAAAPLLNARTNIAIASTTRVALQIDRQIIARTAVPSSCVGGYLPRNGADDAGKVTRLLPADRRYASTSTKSSTAVTSSLRAFRQERECAPLEKTGGIGTAGKVTGFS